MALFSGLLLGDRANHQANSLQRVVLALEGVPEYSSFPGLREILLEILAQQVAGAAVVEPTSALVFLGAIAVDAVIVIAVDGAEFGPSLVGEGVSRRWRQFIQESAQQTQWIQFFFASNSKG